MIYLLVTRRGAHTFTDYLADWTGASRPIFELRIYEDFLNWPAARSGVYIFSDLERLTDAQLAIVCDHADQLQREQPTARLLNHPLRALRRRGLLDALHAAGINRFRAFPVIGLPDDIRYPIFLRKEREHEGPASRLIGDIHSLRLEALRIAIGGIRLDQILGVEYCETRSADGCYRKYSAFRIGDRIIPAHIVFSEHWVAKDGGSTDQQMVEEAAFMRDNPHQAWLRTIFDLARIQYGRIDYSLLDGQPQVWEINTNPVLLKSRAEYERSYPEELPTKDRLAGIIADCFSALNAVTPVADAAAERSISIRRFADLLGGAAPARIGADDG